MIDTKFKAKNDISFINAYRIQLLTDPVFRADEFGTSRYNSVINSIDGISKTM